MHVASDEMIIADDRLSIVLRPTMLLIDFKIKVANIANQKKSGFWLVLGQILFSRYINKKNKMAEVDCLNGNSKNIWTNKGDWVTLIHPQELKCQISGSLLYSTNYKETL